MKGVNRQDHFKCCFFISSIKCKWLIVV